MAFVDLNIFRYREGTLFYRAKTQDFLFVSLVAKYM